MTRLARAAALVALVGCGARPVSAGGSVATPAGHLLFINIGAHGWTDLEYVIDSDSESCFLMARYKEASLAPVKCEVLAAHVPQAAAYMSWLHAPVPPAPDKPAP